MLLPPVGHHLLLPSGRVAKPFGFALTDPSVRLSRTRLFLKVTTGDLRKMSRHYTQQLWSAPCFPRRRLHFKVSRLCVRGLGISFGLLYKLIPSLRRLVSFGGFIGTMNQSDPRPQLGVLLWLSLVARPHRDYCRWPRSGLLGSESNLLYAMRSTSPAERRCLTIATAHVLPSPALTARPPRRYPFRGRQPAPRTIAVYASNHTSPYRSPHSLPDCPLRLCPGRSRTRWSLSAFPAH